MDEPAFDRRTFPAGARLSTWTAPDDWACRRLDWPPEQEGDGQEKRGTLVFAAGRGDFIEKNLEPIAHWRDRGWRVVAFDWRGQGGSRGTIVGGHYDDLGPLVDDLAALIAGEAGRPLVAIGHSMGGHVLLRLLAERAPRIDAAVLVAPMVMVNSAPLPPRIAAAIARAMVALGLGHRPAWRAPATPPPAGSRRQFFLTGSPERYDDELFWWTREPGYNLGAPSWGWLKAAYASSARLTRERLAAIRIPTLFLGTDRDRLVSPSAIRRAAAAIPGADLLMFPDAGHELLREADPVRQVAMARIDAFLDARAPIER